MCLRATILSPLRSKRAMISPVRPRANASGLTRIRVRSTLVLSSGSAALPFALALALTLRVAAVDRLVGDRRLVRRRRAPATARGLRRRRLHLRLAERAQLQ